MLFWMLAQRLSVVDRLLIKEMGCLSHGYVPSICSRYVKAEMGHNSTSVKGKASFIIIVLIKLIQEFRREV